MPDLPDSKELNDLERLISSLRPSPNGLNVDTMLFAAGLAAGRKGRGRVPLSALCGLPAVATAGLAFWGLVERQELIQLASLQQDRRDESRNLAVPPTVEPAPSIYEPSIHDYLSLRRSMEADPNRFVSSPSGDSLRPGELPPPEAEILKMGQRGTIFD